MEFEEQLILIMFHVPRVQRKEKPSNKRLRYYEGTGCLGSNDGSTPDGNRFDSCYEWFKTSI